MKSPKHANVQKGRVFEYAAALFAGVTMLAVFVPLTPEMPGLGNDASWRVALNQAVAQGLVFGKDVIYTYGPYASVFTKSYHPATDWLMLSGSVVLGLCYGFSLIVLARISCRSYVLPVYVTLCAGLMYSHEPIRDAPRDALFYSYPLLLALLTYRIAPDAGIRALLSKKFSIVFAILFLPLGLLPLVKSSFLVICGGIGLCCFLLLLLYRRPKMAATCILLPLLFATLLWSISGQPLLSFSGFFISMKSIIFGYTEAMSVAGNANEIVIYILASMTVLYAVFVSQTASTIQKGSLLISFMLFLFVAFKEGFARHDAHAMVGGTAIALAALNCALALTIKPAPLIVMLVSAALATAYIDGHYVRFSAGTILTNVLDGYRDAGGGLKFRESGQDVLDREFNHTLASIRQQAPFPPMQGTIDIYSYNQSIMFANRRPWSPRPVFQSYQAYTPELEKLNADHLLSTKAPDNIVFRVEPIDDRLPSLEDGASWPLLINNYAVEGADSLFLYLKKRSRSTPIGEHRSAEIATGEYLLGGEVRVPATKEPVFAEINIEPTLLGKIWSTFYKLPELRISITLADYGAKNYRYIPGMGKAGFILSPMVMDTKDFVLLTAAQGDKLAKNIVKSFAISPVGGRSIFWKDTYSAKFITLDLIRDTRINWVP